MRKCLQISICILLVVFATPRQISAKENPSIGQGSAPLGSSQSLINPKQKSNADQVLRAALKPAICKLQGNTTSPDLNDQFKTWIKATWGGLGNLVPYIVGGKELFDLRMYINGIFSIPLFSNMIVDQNETSHYYVYDYGTAETSKYYIRSLQDGDSDYLVPLSNTDDNVAYYETTDANGNDKFAEVSGNVNSSDQGLQIAETDEIDPDTGSFIHHLQFRNDTGDSMQVTPGILVDTMLDDVDDVPIIADGRGGAMIQSPDLRLNLAPVDGAEQYALEYHNYTFSDQGRKKSADYANGQTIIDDADTAIEYEAPAQITLKPNEVYEMSYKEHLTLTSVISKGVIVKYVDDQGKELHSAQKIEGDIGAPYDATTPQYKLDINGYTLEGIPSNAKGFLTKDGDTVTYVYKPKSQGTASFASIPKNLNFGTDNVLPTTATVVLPVHESDQDLVISDTQETRGGWTVQATLKKPLVSDDGKTTLKDALKYDQTVLSDQAATVYTAPSNVGKTTDLTTGWTETTGLHFEAQRNAIMPTTYSSQIEWDLVMAPGGMKTHKPRR